MRRVIRRTRTASSNDYRNIVQTANLGNNVANHMGYIYPMVLYDKFDFTFRQVNNFYTRVIERRKAWQDDNNNDVTRESLVEYCEKKKIDVTGWVKSIPLSQRIFLSDAKNGRVPVGSEKSINYSLTSTMYLTVPTLKDTYKFSNSKIKEFMDWVAYYIDSYWRKVPGGNERYCTDDTIVQAFIIDEHWDIRTGKKVEA